MTNKEPSALIRCVQVCTYYAIFCNTGQHMFIMCIVFMKSLFTLISICKFISVICLYATPWFCAIQHLVPLYVPTCSEMTINLT